MSTTPQPTKTASRRRLFLLASLVVILAAAGAATVYAMSGDGDAGKAERACTEQHVPSRLNLPATEFAAVATAEQPGGVYLVTGTVDATNGLGGLVRSRFECRVEVHDGAVVLQSVTVVNTNPIR